MPTPCDDLPRRTATPPGAALPVARAVAQDLEAIFPRTARTDASQTLHLGHRRPRAGRVPERRGAMPSVGTLGALAAAALAGMSAGVYVDTGHPAGGRARPEQVVLTSNQSLPNPGPLPAGPLHAPPPRILTATPEPVAERPTAKLHKASAGRSVPQRRHVAASRRGNCHYPYCRASSVMEADARLRRAYDTARHAGVSSTVLADYHDRWDSLRHRASREPRLVATRYDEMAGDLNRMAARHAGEDKGRHGAWYNFRTQVAALWR